MDETTPNFDPEIHKRYWVLSTNVLVSVLFVILIYGASKVIYNIYFHPLSKFPGPRLAAASRLYEYFYEIYRHGKFSDHIYELHQRYNSAVIRINPYEIHILDSEFYNELYNYNPDLEKLPNNFNNLQHAVTFEHHKIRRRSFDPFFSRAAIHRLEPIIVGLVGKLCNRLNELKHTGTPATVSLLYRCLTIDIIAEYALSQPYALLDRPEDQESVISALISIFRIVFVVREIPGALRVIHALSYLPAWMSLTDAAAAWTQDFVGGLRKRLRIIKEKISLPDVDNGEHVTFFEQYLKDPKLPLEEKTDEVVLTNAELFITAGMETVGSALSTATFHLLDNPAMYERLKLEIMTVWPVGSSTPSWNTLEKLPYLTAVLKESIRMSVGVMSRLSRVNRKRSIRYRQWNIPPGAAVSMSQRFVLYDPAIFPEPMSFQPERWLQGSESRELEKWLVVFSRGARVCIGQHLAWAEMYITLAAIMHHFDLELFHTSREDIDPKIDYFVPFPATDKGVRVLVE